MDSDHAWFYENNAVRLSVSHQNISRPSENAVAAVAREFDSTREEYRCWKEWLPDVMTQAGSYDCEDINDV